MNSYLPHRCCHCMQGFKVGDEFYNDGFSIYHMRCLNFITLKKLKEQA